VGGAHPLSFVKVSGGKIWYGCALSFNRADENPSNIHAHIHKISPLTMYQHLVAEKALLARSEQLVDCRCGLVIAACLTFTLIGNGCACLFACTLGT